MKAGIFSPYFDTLGGGERYVLSFAKVLKDEGWSVDVESKNPEILSKAELRLGLDLKGINVVPSIKRGDGYDLCFWLSDGSIPTLFARRNILHFQRPFFKVDGKSLLSRMKFFRINKVVVNSNFTKRWVDREYPCESIVIYPPVDVAKFKPGKKENIILYVGRFSQLEQSKRQDILLRAFKKFYDKGFRDWKLVLAGGSDVGRTGFPNKLIRDAKSYPVKIIENPAFSEIKDLYSKTKIFWSASGFGVNEKKEPQKVEHFGISVVEAMAAGAVPLVFNAGGHKEIIEDGKNGYLWSKIPLLIERTKTIIKDPSLFRKLSNQARKDSKKFSFKEFRNGVIKLLL